MQSPELPVTAAFAVALLLLPLQSQIRIRNIAILAPTSCLVLVDISYVVNTMVWAGNIRDVAPIWCDITTNISFLTQYVVSGAALCVCVRLERITSFCNAVSPQRRQVCFEVLVCCILPILFLPLRYASSRSRYMILEDLGCFPAFHPSKFAIALTLGPQIIIAILVICLALKALFNLLHFRYNDKQIVLTRPLFHRILFLCLTFGIVSPIIVFLAFHYILSRSILPWPGWPAVHKRFAHILQFPRAAQFRAVHEMQISIFWMWIAGSYARVALHVSGEEFRNDCRRAWAFLRGGLRHGEDASRPTGTLAHDGSHLPTDTNLNETPMLHPASPHEADHTPSTDP